MFSSTVYGTEQNPRIIHKPTALYMGMKCDEAYEKVEPIGMISEVLFLSFRNPNQRNHPVSVPNLMFLWGNRDITERYPALH